jgi:phage baseplate assembly protein gpV
MFKIYVATKKIFISFSKLWILLIAVNMGKVGFCQATNPTPFDLSISDFTFSTQISSSTIYPTSMQGWMTGTNNLAAPASNTGSPLADEPLVSIGTATTSGLSNLGANGFNFLSTGSVPNQQVGVVALSLNTTNRNSVLVSWTAADQTNDPSSREMNLAMQYRIGTTGVFTTVSATTYTTSNFNQKAPATFLNVLLPSTCDNKAIVQIRWIYFESASQTNNRDAVRLDDITVTSTANSIVAFDNFDRVNNGTVGIPSSEVSSTWTETESGTNRASIDGNQLRLSTSNTPAVGGNNNTAREMVNFDMSSKYSTIFNSSSNDLTWYFNMKQTRSAPSGFSATTYGAAFVLGCNNADFTNASANGYAVIIGNTVAPDNVKLIYFTGGLVGTYANGGVNDIAVSVEAGATPAYSAKVSFNPCTNLWSFQVRNDGASFADPTAGSLGTVYTGTNSTNVNLDLKYMGALWNHQGPASLSDDAYFDNISIPSGISSINTYTWKGTTTDYQIPTNWTPDRNCPKVNDILVFDASSPAVSSVTNIPTQTIGKLLISGNSMVSFRDIVADALPNTIAIGGGSGDDFVVQSGSTFNFDIASNLGTNSMVVSLLTGTTGDISGVVDFVNTFNATSRTHQLLVADANAITVKSGGVVRATKLSGNPFGTALPANVIAFQSGATYESLDGGNPFGLGQPASKVVFQTGSLYKHSQITQPSFSGRTYADFEFNLVGTSSVTGGSFTGVMTADNVNIVNGTLNVTGTLSAAPVNMNIKGNLTVAAGAVFNYSPGAATYASTIGFTSTSSIQKINSAGTITFGRFATLELNNTHTTPRLDVETNINIQGTLKVTAGNLNLSTGDITMQSDAISTANISPVNGTITYSTGRFSIERYLDAIKSWRYLATPVEIASSPTITESWREGGITLTSTGYGTRITGPDFTIAGPLGLDQYTQRPSMKSYNGSSYVGITLADLATGKKIANDEGYAVFVNGGRGEDAQHPTSVSSTTLRIKGRIRTGDQTFNVSAGTFQSVGNPFASRIDFRNVTKNSVSESFYVWNPNGGFYGVGLYEVYSKELSAPFDYRKNGNGVILNTIESGQAFFIQSTSGGFITIKETDKAAGSSLVSRVGVTIPTLDINLHTNDASGNDYVADGVMLNFGSNLSSDLDNYDVKKIANSTDNLAIKYGTKNLVIERRPNLTNTDTIKLNLTSTRIAPYRFEIDPSVLSNTGLDAFLKDKFLQTETPVSLTAVTNVDFDITADAGSRVADRFMIVFKQAQNTSFTTISAIRNADKTVTVQWGIATERNVTNYTVQQSNDGINFTSIATQTPIANNGTNPTYSKQDATASKANNWYRVKANNANGTFKYTAIAMVGGENEIIQIGESKISIYPNPIIDGNVNLHFNNQPKGNYSVQITNAKGQIIQTEIIQVQNNNTLRLIKVGTIARGNYQATLMNEAGNKTTISFVIK